MVQGRKGVGVGPSYQVISDDIGSSLSARVIIKTEAGEVVEVLQQESLVVPAVFEDILFVQNEFAELQISDFFSSSNGRLKFDASGLPNSLTVTFSTGVISGTLVNDDVGNM